MIDYLQKELKIIKYFVSFFLLWWFVYDQFRDGEWVVRLHEMRIFVIVHVGLICQPIVRFRDLIDIK